MAKVLRTKSHPDFSTKGVTLTKEEADQDLIEIWNEAESALDPSDLTDQSFDLDVNSISVNGTNLFPDNDPQDLGIGDDVEFESLDINGNEFVDSSRNVTANEGTFTGDVSLTGATNPNIQITDTTNSVTSLFQALDTGGKVGTLSNHNFWLVSNNSIALTVDTNQNIQVANKLVVGNTLTINSQELFTLGQEQRLSEDATPEFANITISGNDVATETWVSANFDDYSNWTLQDDGGGSNAISSGYTVVITGGENLETSSSSVSNTTTLTIDLSTNFVPETGGTFTGLVTFDSGIKLENTAVPFLDIQVTDNTDNGVIRFQDDGGATIASIETDGFDGAGAGYVNLADAWRVGDEPIASETWVDNNFDNYSNWNIQTDDGVAENVVSNDSVHILGGTDITTTDTTTGSTTEVTINWTGSYPVTSVFGETGDITASASHYNSFFYEQSYIDSNFDDYTNWTLLDDSGSSHAVSSGYNVQILGGTDISTSSTSTSNTTSFTIDFDGDYVPTSGGAFSGNVTNTQEFRRESFSSNEVALNIDGSGNGDFWIWRISANGYATDSDFGFGIKYLGSGSGNDNALVLYSDNQQATQVNAIEILQDGTTTFSQSATFSGQLTVNNQSNLNGNVIINPTGNEHHRFTHSGDWTYIQAGQDSGDTDARLRISRYFSGTNPLSQIEIYSNSTTFIGDVTAEVGEFNDGLVLPSTFAS